MKVSVISVVDNDNVATITVQELFALATADDVHQADESFRRESGRAFVEGFTLFSDELGTKLYRMVQVWKRGNVTRSIYLKRCGVG